MKKNRIKIIFFVLIVLLFIFALSRFNSQSLLHSARQISIYPVLFLLGLQIISQLLVNLQWHKIAQISNVQISFKEMFYINCQGAVMDSITPGVKIGGEVTRAVQLSRHANCSGEQAAAVVALQKLFSLSAFFLINIFAFTFLAGKIPFLQDNILYSIFSFVLLISLIIFIVFFFFRKRVKEFLLNIKKTKMRTMLFLLSFLIWLLYPVKMYILAVQVFPSVNIIYVGAIAFVSYMIAMIPIFPGGLGGFEGSMTGLFLAIGFLQSDALVVTVLFRFVTFWFVMLMSVLYVGWYKVSVRLPKLFAT